MKLTVEAPPQGYPYRRRITTRWTDNDVYGHVNNAVYYHYFDSVINALLIEQGGLDIHDGQTVGFIVRSECDYLKPVAYPAELEVGLAVERLGNSSVTYAMALFEVSASGHTEEVTQACARGRMVHVFVDTASGRPTPIPGRMRQALSAYRVK